MQNVVYNQANIAQRLKLPTEQWKRNNWQLMCETHTAMPGIIKEFDPVRQVVKVQIAVQDKIEIDNIISDEPFPILAEVPIVLPRAGGYALTMPVMVGDECLVIFADMCIDAWWERGGEENTQQDRRRHDLSDGFAILGTWSQPNKMPLYSNNSAMLRNVSGSTYVEVTQTKVNIVTGGLGRSFGSNIVVDPSNINAIAPTSIIHQAAGASTNLAAGAASMASAAGSSVLNLTSGAVSLVSAAGNSGLSLGAGLATLKSAIGSQLDLGPGIATVTGALKIPSLAGIPMLGTDATGLLGAGTGSIGGPGGGISVGSGGITTTGPVKSLWLFASGAGPATPVTPQGSYITWNTKIVNGGATEFINNHGTGTGGWYFFDTPGVGTPVTKVCSIDPSGSIICSGMSTTNLQVPAVSSGSGYFQICNNGQQGRANPWIYSSTGVVEMYPSIALYLYGADMQVRGGQIVAYSADLTRYGLISCANAADPVMTSSTGVWRCNGTLNIYGSSCSVVAAGGLYVWSPDQSRCLQINMSNTWHPTFTSPNTGTFVFSGQAGQGQMWMYLYPAQQINGCYTIGNNGTCNLSAGSYLNASVQWVATQASASIFAFGAAYSGGFYFYANTGLTVGAIYGAAQIAFLDYAGGWHCGGIAATGTITAPGFTCNGVLTVQNLTVTNPGENWAMTVYCSPTNGYGPLIYSQNASRYINIVVTNVGHPTIGSSTGLIVISPLQVNGNISCNNIFSSVGTHLYLRATAGSIMIDQNNLATYSTLNFYNNGSPTCWGANNVYYLQINHADNAGSVYMRQNGGTCLHTGGSWLGCDGPSGLICFRAGLAAYGNFYCAGGNPNLGSTTGVIETTVEFDVITSTGYGLVVRTAASGGSWGSFACVGAQPGFRSSNNVIWFYAQASFNWSSGILIYPPDNSRYGQWNCANAGHPTFGSTTGLLVSNCAIQQPSDYRIKKNVETLDSALSLVLKLRPVSFEYIDVGELNGSIFRSDGRRHIGFLAHELQEVLPSSVSGEKDAVNTDGTTRPQTAQLWDLVAVLTRAVQELSAKLDIVMPEFN